jgi:hypothetical protein
MKKTSMFRTIATSVLLCGAIAFQPVVVGAQEAEKKNMPGMKGHEHMMGEMHGNPEMRAQMQKMHQEMQAELQKQLTALREHAKAMDGITDEKQLLAEMKKHQQMTDDLLGTMVEQREKMHAQMQKRREQMHGQMRKGQPMEGSATEPSGEHEQHHDK